MKGSGLPMTELSLSQGLIDDLLKQYPEHRELITKAIAEGDARKLYDILGRDITTTRNSWETVEILDKLEHGGAEGVLAWVSELLLSKVALEFHGRLQQELSPGRRGQLPA